MERICKQNTIFLCFPNGQNNRMITCSMTQEEKCSSVNETNAARDSTFFHNNK